MLKSIKNNLQNTTQPIIAELNECFKIVEVEILPSERENYITDNPIKVCLCFESLFPRELVCQKAAINIEDFKESINNEKPEKPSDKSNKTDNLNNSNNVSSASPARKPGTQNNTVVTSKKPQYVSR